MFGEKGATVIYHCSYDIHANHGMGLFGNYFYNPLDSDAVIVNSIATLTTNETDNVNFSNVRIRIKYFFCFIRMREISFFYFVRNQLF